jgi:type I protein arginine methyltransferase
MAAYEEISEWFSDPGAHKRLLEDTVRCDALRRAIQIAVLPGDVVVDVGAGTGLLSFFAVQAGARRVYAIDFSTIADLAAELIQANGFGDKITLIRENSKAVHLPELCDVLISETLGSFCFDGENAIEFISDARDRFLKQGGTLIPASAETLIMPVTSDAFGVGGWADHLYDLEFAPFRRKLFSHVSLVRADKAPFEQLSPPAACYQIDFRTVTRNPGKTFLPFRIARSGRLDGFLGWFKAQLCGDIFIDNSPYSPRTNWPQTYFPTLEQPQVQVGQTIVFELEPLTIKDDIRWSYSTKLLRA